MGRNSTMCTPKKNENWVSKETLATEIKEIRAPWPHAYLQMHLLGMHVYQDTFALSHKPDSQVHYGISSLVV